jgi:hypothetical protein
LRLPAAPGEIFVTIKWDRVISVATLVTSVAALILVLKRPQPVAPPPVPPAAMQANADSFSQKMEQLERPAIQGEPATEVRFNAQEVTAALAQAAGALPAGNTATAIPSASDTKAGGLTSLSGDLGPGEPNVKDYQVNFDGDQVVGQFLTQVAGKDVWITLRGHLGSKDGYATFEPTEIKVGDLSVPVSLVNDQLQKKLLEQKDRLKLPDTVGGVKVEKGELVLTNK